MAGELGFDFQNSWTPWRNCSCSSGRDSSATEDAAAAVAAVAAAAAASMPHDWPEEPRIGAGLGWEGIRKVFLRRRNCASAAAADPL